MRLLATSLIVLLTSATAQAGMILSFQELGSGGVQASYSGNLNLSALSGGAPTDLSGFPSSVNAVLPQFYSQTSTSTATVYQASTFWDGFGTGGTTAFDSASGDLFAFYGSSIAVAQGYTSGSLITGSGLINTGSFASLGLTPGTYTTTFSSLDANGTQIRDFVTVIIGVVPEPGSLSLWSVGLAGLAFSRRRRS